MEGRERKQQQREAVERLRIEWAAKKASGIVPPIPYIKESKHAGPNVDMGNTHGTVVAPPSDKAEVVVPPPIPVVRSKPSPLTNLLRLYPYQQRWIQDNSRFRISDKSRQIGMSFVTALEGALVARATNRNQIYLSKSERQSKILAEKATAIAKALDIASSPIHEDMKEFEYEDSKIECLQLEIKYPNGTKQYFLPAKPETARSYSGDVYLDEFAFHADAAKIYTALYPTITRGFRISIVSTPNGQIGKYYEFAKSAGMVAGYAKEQFSPWSAHKTDIYLAVMEGMAAGQYPNSTLQIHPDIIAEISEGFNARGMKPSKQQLRFVCELRSGIDDRDTWLQEFECAFLSASANYIPIELILRAEEGDLGTELLPEEPLAGRLFLGIDIGRKKHRTVFWLLEEVGSLLITRAVIVLNKATFQDQENLASKWMSQLGIYKCCIDGTGMGMQVAESMERNFPGRVETVTFTLQSKDELATLMRKNFEMVRYRIPSSPIIRQDINGIKRGVTKAGNIIFSAEDTKDGHSDRAWALALATRAADQPVAPSISMDNFIGLNRNAHIRVPDVPTWESRDLISLWPAAALRGR